MSDALAGWPWWPPRSEHGKVYDFNLELDVSTHLDSLPPFPFFVSPLLSSVCPHQPRRPTTRSFPFLRAPCNASISSFFHFPLSASPATPTLFLSPTPPVYLFFHQIELVKSKGIPTIPSQSWVRERGTLKMKGSGAQFRCRSLRVCCNGGWPLPGPN